MELFDQQMIADRLTHVGELLEATKAPQGLLLDRIHDPRSNHLTIYTTVADYLARDILANKLVAEQNILENRPGSYTRSDETSIFLTPLDQLDVIQGVIDWLQEMGIEDPQPERTQQMRDYWQKKAEGQE